MFNKRETRSDQEESSNRTAGEARAEPSPPEPRPGEIKPGGGRKREAAVIGPSIHIDGDLRGEEDLVIEGEVKGTVHLKNDNLTIGTQGKVMADVYANTIVLEGFMKGDFYATEGVTIRKSARMQGNIHSPRVALEDGAKFKGSIEMDPESDALKSAFGSQKAASTNAGAKSSTTGRDSGAGSGEAGKPGTQPPEGAAGSVKPAERRTG